MIRKNKVSPNIKRPIVVSDKENQSAEKLPPPPPPPPPNHPSSEHPTFIYYSSVPWPFQQHMSLK